MQSMHDVLSVEMCTEFLEILQQRDQTLSSCVAVVSLATDTVDWTVHFRAIVTDRPHRWHHGWHLRRLRLLTPTKHNDTPSPAQTLVGLLDNINFF